LSSALADDVVLQGRDRADCGMDFIEPHFLQGKRLDIFLEAPAK